ncbi:MAG: hypothetical protein OXH27_07290 [Gammaproteobacteria bacterium]|nr:hypothetical protein [Gammaproteobacteria bacterium]
MNLAERTLGGVFPDRDDRMSILVRTLREDHWPPELLRLWKLLREYFVLTAGVPSRADFRSMVDRTVSQEATRQALLLAFVRCWKSGSGVSDSEWRYAMEAMCEDRAADLLVDTLVEAMQMVTEGREVAGVRQRGYEPARGILVESIGKIESLRFDGVRSVEGDVRLETEDIWDEYSRAQQNGDSWGVLTGFSDLDRITNGIQRGEFWLVAGYSGHGKTQALINIAHRAVVDGRRVVFFTLETLREQVRRRLVVRHSQEFGQGVRYNAVRSGDLSEAEERVFREALDDFSSGDYGSCEVVWAARNTTTEELQLKTESLDRVAETDLVIVDYVGLMGVERRFSNRGRQERLVEILQALKGFATGHRKGAGVPVISAYQTSRQAVERARYQGGYTLDGLAETAEAERSADLVLSLLMLADDDRDISAQILKYRDGRKGEFTLHSDFSRSLVSDRPSRSGGGGGLL